MAESIPAAEATELLLQRTIQPEVPLPSICDALANLREQAAEYEVAVRRFEDAVEGVSSGKSSTAWRFSPGLALPALLEP